MPSSFVIFAGYGVITENWTVTFLFIVGMMGIIWYTVPARREDLPED
ncbi:MAG TPA: hypothetical protein VMT44_02370 [Methanoregula sp.]|nr:hypothetical protein [Methanoregula sp.]